MESASSLVEAQQPAKQYGLRVNGKNWHAPKKAFRPTSGQTSYAKRKEADKIKQATKAREAELKEDKEQEEKERYEKMAEKMHRKLVERRKRREKRNKLLKS